MKNRISKNVKNQYEENPYPRWENLGLSIEPREIKEVINDNDLNLDLKKIIYVKLKFKIINWIKYRLNQLIDWTKIKSNIDWMTLIQIFTKSKYSNSIQNLNI